MFLIVNNNPMFCKYDIQNNNTLKKYTVLHVYKDSNPHISDIGTP